MFRNADFRYFDKAKQIASISDYHKTHIACVAVYQGQIIGLGCNCNKTHPVKSNMIGIGIYILVVKQRLYLNYTLKLVVLTRLSI